MIVLWGRASSINVQKVVWALEEIGLAHQIVPAGGAHGGLNTATFLALNPHGRIPVLVDDGTVIWESSAIVRYLCSRYSVGVLWPKSPAERAMCDQWMDWCACTLQPAFMNFFWSWWRTPEAERDEELCAVALARSNEAFARLDAALIHPPLDHPSMADFPFGVMLHRYFTMPIERAPLRRLEAWHDHLRKSPAYRRAVMIPFEDLRGRLAF